MPQHKETPGETVVKSGRTFGRPAALYNRRSTAGQGDPGDAMADLRQAAQQRGYHVAMEIAETGSGARNDRPGLQQVLDAARRGKLSAVLVQRLDRFGRSSLDLLANISALRDAGVEFIAVEQGLHVRPNGDAMSGLLLTVLSGVAEFEKAIIRSRVIEGQRRAMERGQHIGRPRAEGPTPGQVRKMRAAGKSWGTISKTLGCTVAMARRRYEESSSAR
jgi:putative DNA-invertase from lambdoid prophage Rac